MPTSAPIVADRAAGAASTWNSISISRSPSQRACRSCWSSIRMPDLTWSRTWQEPPGTQAARWDRRARLLAMGSRHARLCAGPRRRRRSGPSRSVSGVTRPERGTNLWISDPAQSLPQWWDMAWPRTASRRHHRTHLRLPALRLDLGRRFPADSAGLRRPGPPSGTLTGCTIDSRDDERAAPRRAHVSRCDG